MGMVELVAAVIILIPVIVIAAVVGKTYFS